MYSKPILAGLVIIAILTLGYFGYFKFYKKQATQPIPSNQQQPKELTLNDIAKLLQSSPSAKQTEQIFEFVERLGKEGSKVSLNDCKVDPQILKTSASEITINNTGAKEARISGISALKNSILAGQAAALKIDPGLYIYSCEPGSADRLERMGLIYKTATLSAQKSSAQNYKDQAVSTTAIEFNKCDPSPQKIKIHSGDKITVKNNNSYEVNFYFSADNGKSTKISPKQTIALTPTLQGDLTWYGCFAKDIIPTTGVIVTAL